MTRYEKEGRRRRGGEKERRRGEERRDEGARKNCGERRVQMLGISRKVEEEEQFAASS